MRSRFLKIAMFTALATLIGFSACINPRQGYAPTQPIAFSHQLHAGQNQIPCRYCHTSVGEGPHASVPSVNTCMNCHSLVKTNSPEIRKIHAAWKSDEPIEWIKVHDLPDHARFSHQPHITAGVDCVECHTSHEAFVEPGRWFLDPEAVRAQCARCHGEFEGS